MPPKGIRLLKKKKKKGDFATNKYAILTFLFFTSIFANPRRLEALTHPFWTEILLSVFRISVAEILLAGYYTVVYPQMAIWVSKTDPQAIADPDTSILTNTDRYARGVVVDFAVVLLTLRPLHPSQRATTVRSMVNIVWSTLFRLDISRYASDYTIGDQIVALLLELKRPAPRHSPDIEAFVKALRQSLQKARAQVLTQALCFFLSSQRFKRQKHIFVMVGCGEWFQVRIVSTKSITTLVPELVEEVADLDDLTPSEGFYWFHELCTRFGLSKAAERDEEDLNDDEPSIPTYHDLQSSRLEAVLKTHSNVTADRDKTAQIKSDMLQFQPPFSQDELDYYVRLTTGQEFSHELPLESPRHALRMDDFKGWTRPINVFTKDADRVLHAIRDLSKQYLAASSPSAM